MSDFDYYVDAEKIRVMRTLKGSTFIGDQAVVALCATGDAGGMKVALRICDMLNGSIAHAQETNMPDDGSCCRCGAAPRNASGLCATCVDEDAVRAGEIEADNAPTRPDDHVLMPRVATRTMTMAGCDCLPACDHVFGHAGEMLKNAYAKMVEVAAVEASPSAAMTKSADPVAWQYELDYPGLGWIKYFADAKHGRPGNNNVLKKDAVRNVTPLYAAPPSPDTVREADDLPRTLIGAIVAALGQRVRLMHPNGQDQARHDLNAFKAWADAREKRPALSSAPVAPAAPVATTPDQWQDIAHEARFLLDRLEELDDANDKEYVREFEGHVRPPMSRLRRLLPRNDRVASQPDTGDKS